MSMGRNAPSTMLAMVLEQSRQGLVAKEVPIPKPEPKQVLLRVQACGVCRTDLHVVDGELTQPKLPLIPGHQIVGTVAGLGSGGEYDQARRPCWSPLAGVDLRSLRVLHRRKRESL